MRIAATILRALAEPVLVLDGSLHAVLANPAFLEIMRIAPNKLEGKSVHDLIVAKTGKRELTTLLTDLVARKSGSIASEIVCTVPPNMRKVLAVAAQCVSFGEDTAPIILLEFRDITPEKDAELRVQKLNDALVQHGAELESINKELDSFTHSVSHDLRSPLRLTNKIAHLLLHDHGPELPAGALDKVQMILNSTHEMGKLIEDLLLFSQLKNEPMKKRRVDMQRLARAALGELSGELDGRSVEVQIDELPYVQADRALMKQVFLNLLGNALKFTRPCENAQIKVGTKQNNGETVYFVRDNGVGFEPGHSDALFLVFHRLHKSHNFEGSGVGLALVKRIVERHGGRIWAEGVTNLGATFYFTLSA